ncbi:MAG: class I SAM-dependent methyltransferase [Candidatus Omnitrophota bacterium]
MDDGFYRAFEDRYRGSRELIKLRLRAYLPFVRPLLGFYEKGEALDLGCGRGEWLELLAEAGFDATGVDLDNTQLATCKELGLNVRIADAIDFIKRLPDANLVLVTAFHLVEHLQFSQLQNLVKEALRVLKPGGILILETPNPENILTGTSNFYLDPMHQRPIPPQLLSFLPEYYGFRKVTILRLQETVRPQEKEGMSLLDVLNGVSPDYSVIAQREGDQNLLDATKGVFDVDTGCTLEQMIARYESYTDGKIKKLSPYEHQVFSKTHNLESALQQATTWFVRNGDRPVREDVIAAYRCFLGREPESENVIQGYLKAKNVKGLLKAFSGSEEFQGRINRFEPSDPEETACVSYPRRLSLYFLDIVLGIYSRLFSGSAAKKVIRAVPWLKEFFKNLFSRQISDIRLEREKQLYQNMYADTDCLSLSSLSILERLKQKVNPRKNRAV